MECKGNFEPARRDGGRHPHGAQKARRADPIPACYGDPGARERGKRGA
jgi:hypothetical protein